MRGVEESEQPNPRLEEQRIRVSDILYALRDENPTEQFETWGIEQYKVFGAIQYYWQNKDEFETCYDDDIRAWDGFGDTVVQFDDAVGTGTQFCPDCDGRLETDWDNYSLVCQICSETFRSEELTVLWREEDY